MRYGWRSRQGGATFLGMVTIISILGLAVYAGIRLIPIYSDFFSVSKALNDISKSVGDSPTPAEIRKALEARWAIDYIKDIEPKDIEVTRVANGMEVRAAYRAEAPFIANISLVVDFDKAVVIGAGADGP
jgi:hypothetical protein